MKIPTNTGGVKPMDLEGRMKSERERLVGMTDAERAWRKQWLKDQVLSENEPRFVPELHKELTNPIRRFYQKPLDVFCARLVPLLGVENAAFSRRLIPKLLFLISGAYVSYYHLKYNQNDWTRRYGWSVATSRPTALPGDPDFPRGGERSKPEDYSDKGFKSRTVFLD